MASGPTPTELLWHQANFMFSFSWWDDEPSSPSYHRSLLLSSCLKNIFRAFTWWCGTVKLAAAVMRQICSCQWDKFIPGDLELLSLEGFSEIIQYFSYCVAVIPFFLWLLTRWAWTLDQSQFQFVFYLMFPLFLQLLGYTRLTKHKEVKQGRKFKLKFKCPASTYLIKKKKPIT